MVSAVELLQAWTLWRANHPTLGDGEAIEQFLAQWQLPRAPVVFCESSSAGGLAVWHLRQLSDAGPKYGGGLDTPSLCGRVKPPYGWDLEVAVTERHLLTACPACVAAFRARP